MKFLLRLGGDDELQSAVYPAHNKGHINKELLLEQLGVVLGKYTDCLSGGGLDTSILSEKADRLVVVNLENLLSH
jgi:hypothetical protein